MTELERATQSVPPDRQARDRISRDLETTLFVEAGAGSGKTSALVDRVLAMVRGGHQLGRIAAITFTEKAGSELRDRIRAELEKTAAAHPDTADEVGARCRHALQQLDGAAIGTLHSFAQRLLTEHPVEAGLPPRIQVLDEVSSSVAFDTRWATFQDQLLADPVLERTVLLLFASGVKQPALRALAAAFDDNWDLVSEHVPSNEPEPPPVRDLFRRAVGAVTMVCAEPCLDPGDKLRLRLDEIAASMAELATIEDEFDLLEALGPQANPKLPSFKVRGSIGKKQAWPCDLDDLKERIVAAGEQLAAVAGDVSNACARRLGSTIRAFTLDSVADRQRAGELEFHDLLVLARALLRDPVHGPGVRATLHDRYDRLLLDEFQDTDPIQIELAVRIAAADPRSPATGAEPWDRVEVTPGHLFVVGDPKQSIYRFRRADIATFLRASKRFGPEAGGVVELTANFRTAEPIIDWVNHVFGALMHEPVDVVTAVPSQPDYLALSATRPAAPAGPPVAVIGRTEHPKNTSADIIRSAEAREVAATVTRIMDERWEIFDKKGGTWRPARLGDITVLVPARTSLPFLEDVFDESGIAFRAETSSLVYASRAVRDLLMVLRAVDDPTNHLHVVSALRTPLLACGDDDLFRFKSERGGHWGYLGDQPETVPPADPVRAGLAYLRSLYDERAWLAPSELLGRIARDRRAMELGFAEGRPRDVWRRLRFVIDQARAWSEATGGNLRQYLHWVERQTAEGARVTESILPESDDDAVRILTIHGAKGLEFPITIVSGMSTVPSGQRAPAEVVFPDPYSGMDAVGYRFGNKVTTDEFRDQLPIDEQMGLHERIRLLYVACTRARDHLIVSLHRKGRATAVDSLKKRTNAEILVDGMGTLLGELPDAVQPSDPLRPAALEPPTPPPPFEAWASERASALGSASRPTTVAATALTEEGEPDVEAEPDPGLQKRPRDLDLPPWLKGRYGTAIGRAVHGVLQTIDLATGAGLDDALAAQCEAEAVPDHAETVRARVLHALGSPSVVEAAASPHWREIYVCTPVDDRLLEGYIDLLYRGPEGLVVVDYKTAATSDPDELDRRVEGYRLQGASYALTVGASTAEPVTRVTFLFLTPDGAIERHLPDLDETVAEINRLVLAGSETVTD